MEDYSVSSRSVPEPAQRVDDSSTDSSDESSVPPALLGDYSDSSSDGSMPPFAQRRRCIDDSSTDSSNESSVPPSRRRLRMERLRMERRIEMQRRVDEQLRAAMLRLQIDEESTVEPALPDLESTATSTPSDESVVSTKAHWFVRSYVE